MTGEAASATVLVVEDAMIPRLALARGVEQLGHRVLLASDGREALQVLGTEEVDMVLLDLLMPEVDGFGVLEAMRADPALSALPVLVISAIEATDDIARAIELGAIDCLPKPYEPAMLRVRLHTALEQTRLRRVEREYLRQEITLRQQERLATLGRLSAGLGHELNNPAAAALSTARQLRRALARAEEVLPQVFADGHGAALVDATADVLRVDDAERPAPERPPAPMEVHEDLEDMLDSRGVDEPWDVAGELAAAGLLVADVERVLASGAPAQLAMEWLRLHLRVRRAVEHITGSVARMAELTSALRGYSYLDRAPQQDVDIRRGLEDTLTILAHKLPDGVTVSREYAPHLPAVHGFGGQLNQVWTNLVDNAIDAVGQQGTVVVRARAVDAGVEVQVADDGPGVPEALQGSIFDPFVTTKPPGHGTGLGLNISHHIVTEAHGGRMSVESEPGRTVFTVWVPAMPPGGSEHDD
jgi:signal transduction histidine kinase